MGFTKVTEGALERHLDGVSDITCSQRDQSALGRGVAHVTKGVLTEHLLTDWLDAIILLEEEIGWHHDDGEDGEDDDHGGEQITVSDHSETQNQIGVFLLLFLSECIHIALLLVGHVSLLLRVRIQEGFFMRNCVILLGTTGGDWLEEGENGVERVARKRVAFLDDFLGC
jgi:hypothetical protein